MIKHATKFFCSAMFKLSEFEQLSSAFQNARAPVELSGLSPVHKAQLIAAMQDKFGKPAVVLCSDESYAKKLSEDISSFSECALSYLPERDLSLAGDFVCSHEWEQARIRALASFISGSSAFLVGSVGAFMLRTMPPDTLRALFFQLHTGDEISINSLARRLVSAGYVQSHATEGVGQFSIRGGIADIFSPNYTRPLRIEFFGDTIDSISFFDTQSQRRQETTGCITILPVRETVASDAVGGIIGAHGLICQAARSAQAKNLCQLQSLLLSDAEKFLQANGCYCPDRLIPFIYHDCSCAADYFSDSLIFIDDAARVYESADSFTRRMREDISSLIQRQLISADFSDFFCPYSKLSLKIKNQNLFLLNTFSSKKGAFSPKTLINIPARQLPSYNGSFDALKADIEYYFSNKYHVAILCGGEQRCKNLVSMLIGSQINAVYSENPSDFLPPGVVLVTSGRLSAGFEYPDLKLALITEEQLSSGSRTSKKSKRQARDSRSIVKNYTDLRPGDIVVHETHGIGRFVGIERLCVDNAERDYIRLAFAGTDTLFLPVSSLDVISKYIGAGGEDSAVKLSRLGGTDWQRKKQKARGAAEDMAKKLVALYAERQRRPGFAFLPDDDQQLAFEEAFDHDETGDQLRCVAEIKRDMQSSVPMDRLLCGDVGFGKTEVAFRAVMKCILSGKQAAMLVPTTVLARQHYLTALRRFKGTAVQIDMLSRFKTGDSERKILSGLKSGRIDLIIGTHKLLGKQLEFRDLGLLVVDEEQRFGVSHKETIKQMAKNIDVLTLSATPIPRTLGMALSGIRDMSIIEEPPLDRQPVSTYVMEYDFGVVLDAIRREISRGGQVYYLHNRTESVASVAARLRQHLPDINIAYAHGQMSEQQISSVMQELSDGDVQVLVCTTIIETGIDIPNVNTLIIENSENFGLSQLHQLRGRVGRAARRAYAYFTYRPGKVLTETSQKRLASIREFAEFGAGFKIAMRDLEIRGAGNVLGSEQSGHLASVGYDLYLKLLESAVLSEQGLPPKNQRAECTADFQISANIPETFVKDSGERIDLYRRIARIRNPDDYSDLIDELIDRYGDPPQSVISLLDISLLRADAANVGISDLSHKQNSVIIKFAHFDFARISAICSIAKYKGRLLLSAGKEPYLSLRLKSNESPLVKSRELIDDLRNATRDTSQTNVKNKASV